MATAIAGLAWALATVALRATGATQRDEKDTRDWAILMLQCRVDAGIQVSGRERR